MDNTTDYPLEAGDYLLPAERYRIAAKLCECVENPVFALDQHEIQELLLDLALMLGNSEQRSEQSESIFEDRQGRSDELGNIRMIYRTEHSVVEPRLLSWLSEQLVELHHLFVEYSHKSNLLAQKFPTVDFAMDDWDLRETDQLLEAKKKVLSLKRDLYRSEAHNTRLFGQIKWLKSSKQKLANQLQHYRGPSRKLQLQTEEHTKTVQPDFMSGK